MSAAKNRYGLSRDIPNTVSRLVRKKCGFGCVVCGCALYQYEHVDPPFYEASEHDPEKIVLLCGACHDRVTRGFLSKDSIKVAAQKPKCLSTGFSFGPFDLGQTHIDVQAGPLKAIETWTLIRVYDIPIFQIKPPEADGAPFQLSAFLCDSQGQVVLHIENNEWKTPTANWDVQVTKSRITIHRAHKDIVLQLKIDPARTIIIERLNMRYQDVVIKCLADKFLVTLPTQKRIELTQSNLKNCDVAVDISVKGINIGRGCKSADIKKFVIDET